MKVCVSLPRFLRESRRVYRPGIPALPPGVERYEIGGLAMRVFAVFGGDRLRIVDVEGGQAAEVSVFDSAGKSDAGLLSAVADGRAEGLKTILAKDENARFADLFAKN
ncbi:MAG: hypothetical protein ACR2QC_09520, partial [Gammaproteobacteria bacterium]